MRIAAIVACASLTVWNYALPACAQQVPRNGTTLPEFRTEVPRLRPFGVVAMLNLDGAGQRNAVFRIAEQYAKDMGFGLYGVRPSDDYAIITIEIPPDGRITIFRQGATDLRLEGSVYPDRHWVELVERIAAAIGRAPVISQGGLGR
jgi:hypothetical protein